MAAVIPVNSQSNHLRRLTGNAPISGDYSCTFWLKRTGDRTTVYRNLWSAQNLAYDEWVGIYSVGAVDGEVYLESDNGGTFAGTASVSESELHRWIPYAYVRSGTTHSYYALGILYDSFSLNLSGTGIDRQFLGGDGSSAPVNCSSQVMLLREWTTALTLAELIAEWNSPTVVKTASLWSNCPLISDANDISGNARHYAEVGTITYATSPTPVPLTNTSSGAAFDITGALPREIVQVVRDSAGTIYDSWFKRTISADGQYGAMGWGGMPTTAGDYWPGLRVYADGALSGNYLGIPTSYNHPLQFPAESGEVYYFEMEKAMYLSGTIQPPCVLYLILPAAAPSTAVAARQIFINDDTSGFPAAILSSTVDYEVAQFIPGMPAGEAGDIASNGNYLLDDILSNDVKMFDRSGNLLFTYPSWSTFGYVIRKHLRSDSFYVTQLRSTGAPELTLKKISRSGAVLSSVTMTGVAPSTGAQAVMGIAANVGETILYYVTNAASAIVKRWDLIAGTTMSDLVPALSGHNAQDILGLPDDTILVAYHDRPSSYIVKRYDSSGNTLNTFDVTSYVLTGYLDFTHRLAYDPDAPGDYFWVYVQRATPSFGNVKVLKIRISDGAVVVERNHALFQAGASPNDNTYYSLIPLAYYGPSGSCPFFLFPEEEEAGDEVTGDVPAVIDDLPVPDSSVICVQVSRRLGDLSNRIWSDVEIDNYLMQGAREMCTQNQVIWDWVYPENLPRGFSYNHTWELDIINEGRWPAIWKYGPEDGMGTGQGNYTADFERRFVVRDPNEVDTWADEDIREGFARHTFPDEISFLVELGSDQQSPISDLPHRLTEMERALNDKRTVDASSHRDHRYGDSRYEIEEGEVHQYTWRKDGPRTFRKIRVPNQVADTYEIDGLWGIARDVTDLDYTGDGVTIEGPDSDPTSLFGIPRQVPGEHPIGPFKSYRMWGLPRRFYRDGKNVRVEHWRIPFFDCYDSELPPRYRQYLVLYAMWRCLSRQGPGQDMKLAGWYRVRWNSAMTRIHRRVNRQIKERTGRLGGTDRTPSTTGHPPRPRLPWQYGKPIR